MRNGAHLIAYADRLGADLKGLGALLDGPLAGFAGVHVLPFFTPFDGHDAGFDPVDHESVDPRLGTWEDVRALADRGLDVTADLVVNHLSADSEPFRDWLRRGDESPYAGMFLTYDSVFPSGATESDLTRIYRPRPGLPFTPFVLGDGTRRLVWTTFEATQIDLDVHHPAARGHLERVLRREAEAGVRTVRLDAVGYAVKRAGTRCFLEDATLRFVDELTDTVHGLAMEVLVEFHGHVDDLKLVAPLVDRVYDFALPPLVLHALTTGDGAPLGRWLEQRPGNVVTVLDTHDGIGIIDVAAEPGRQGLLGDEQIGALADHVASATGGLSTRASRAIPWRRVPYQLNATFHDALGRDDSRTLAARLIQLFTPGVPMVYYVGLLAGRGDVERFERTGVGRDVNRHAYSAEELDEALAQPVVEAMLQGVRLRGAHPAFDGACHIDVDSAGVLRSRWTSGSATAELEVELATARFSLRADAIRPGTHQSGSGDLVATDVRGMAELGIA